ncbi:DeoR/GlpR family DNA-binding transcription regulator [Clostridium estertheticum]|uniref:DeoR/GlpR family DNA-binding transcription regulator n=1 Tax=Clostridium estertheticum TaxID=238834 RepID=A0AA47EEC4_9CLOT|nr:DeoR/GlpR family DNA-binding transcription regulator [Clostridium estertheticum]MBU3157981.1 DeoR/GlpR family DNA-binding transcription regulator [Clostridium estertheticum]MBU3199444.1 DeoR/GlpR family DNA-binding transcription regulator [Clostridium estertheticum]WAG58651.1 DeoR/GlpR family DNA-binding transcription regulator [Clostridium estertheticum]WAG67312.1 DeoR/GlpR family DNA-binding transcription regulator [Clostridium estertheticum]
MLPIERLEIIKQTALSEKKLYVSKLSEKFDVTEETIRRDLEKLEQQGLVTRSYGGAILNAQITNEDIPFYKRSKTDMGEKIYIASKAIEFIKEDSTIMADCSSTVLEVLKLIKDRSDVTVITNSVEVLSELNQSELNIISTGGSIKQRSLSLQGPITQSTIRKYSVDLAFVSCKGMDIKKGILDSNEEEAEIKNTMIKQASKVILLIDHSKYDKTSFVKLFDYENIDYIITDKEPREEWLKLLHSNNIEIIY